MPDFRSSFGFGGSFFNDPLFRTGFEELFSQALKREQQKQQQQQERERQRREREENHNRNYYSGGSKPRANSSSKYENDGPAPKCSFTPRQSQSYQHNYPQAN